MWNVSPRSTIIVLEVKKKKYIYIYIYIHIRARKTDVLQNSMLNMESKLFNKLPERIRIFEDLRSFKKGILFGK
jgi:hypothetical protein